MPVPETATEFVELVGTSGLVPAADLAAFQVANLGTDALPPRELAARFVAAGLLTEFQAGQLLLGKWKNFFADGFRIEDRLPLASRFAFFFAVRVADGTPVALKLLPRPEDIEQRATFLADLEAARRVDHPNVMRVHGLAKLTPSPNVIARVTFGRVADDQECLVLERIDGVTLTRLVETRGRVPLTEACGYARQAALGLAALHAAGVYVPQLHTGKIMVRADGVVKVVGFPLLVERCTSIYVLPKHALNFLSCYCLAPSAALSRVRDPLADVYSLGCVLYALLAGRFPFPGPSITAVLLQHQTCRPPPIADIPPELAAVVERMMAKNPAARFPTMTAVADALTPWASPNPTPVELPDANAPVAHELVAPRVDPVFPSGNAARFRDPWWVVALRILVAVVILGGYLMYKFTR